LAVKVRVSGHRDNTPSRDHVIAVCNKFDLVFVGVADGNCSVVGTRHKHFVRKHSSALQ